MRTSYSRGILILTVLSLIVSAVSPSYAAKVTKSHGEVCTIVGTAGDDTLIGTEGDDVICGLGGDDELVGNGGDDLIDGGSGNDYVSAGEGADSIFLGAGNDALDAGSGDDLVDGGSGDDIIELGEGNDISAAGAGADKLFGDAGADLIQGGTGNDWMSGGTGLDSTNGNGGNNQCSGDPNDVKKNCTFNNTGPQLISIALADDSREIDVSNGDTVLHLRARVANYHGTGLQDVVLGFYHPANNKATSIEREMPATQPQTDSVMATVMMREGMDNECLGSEAEFSNGNTWAGCLSAGTTYDGVYDFKIKLPEFMKTGRYWLSYFGVTDPLTNWWNTQWWYEDLSARGFNVSFTQTKVFETNRPKLLTAAFDAGTINTYHQDNILRLRTRVQDETGISSIRVSLIRQNGDSSEPRVYLDSTFREEWFVDKSETITDCEDPEIPAVSSDPVGCRTAGNFRDGIYEFSWLIPRGYIPPREPNRDVGPRFYLMITLTDQYRNETSAYFAPNKIVETHGSMLRPFNNKGVVLGVLFRHAQ